MGGELAVPSRKKARKRSPGGGDHGYEATQAMLRRFEHRMGALQGELDALQRRQRANALLASNTADQVAHAELDPKHVELTRQVASALNGANAGVRRLAEVVQGMVGRIGRTKALHRRLYAGLHRIRSNRPERAPKPGFLTHGN